MYTRASLQHLGGPTDCTASPYQGMGVSQDRQVPGRHAPPHDRGILDGLHDCDCVLPCFQTDAERRPARGGMHRAVEASTKGSAPPPTRTSVPPSLHSGLTTPEDMVAFPVE